VVLASAVSLKVGHRMSQALRAYRRQNCSLASVRASEAMAEWMASRGRFDGIDAWKSYSTWRLKIISAQSERILWGYENDQKSSWKMEQNTRNFCPRRMNNRTWNRWNESIVFSIDISSVWITVSLASVLFNEFKSSIVVCNHVGIYLTSWYTLESILS